ncbi:hypothetical protein LS71_005070 [Helicobacter jaachi]|uniref:Conjugal transfer protein TraF n=1 Tax=Helicobacter jaachi TaxID=1677920 RepID=A0A4U8TB45_9HELI|nr:conjugal transfer protein TraF [Helicobacter jaachi]TLD96963.1 hypothetical protein LS71_005070 [Helicobacter jaachi]
MTSLKKICVFSLVWVVSGFGLEFGTMGNAAAGMGGAGVAVRDSAWGLYYNPALLGADRRSKFGYSFGVQFKEQNLLQLATIDTAALEDLPAKLTSQLTGSGSGGTNVTIGGTNVSGALGGTLNALFPNSNGNITVDNVKDLASEVTGNTQTCVDMTACWDSITGTDALAKLKDKLSSAATEGGSPLVGSIINGVEPDKLVEIMKEASSGNFDANTMLKQVGKITIAKGADSVIDKLLNDFGVIDSALKGNDVNITTQNGFVFQIAGDKKTRRVENDAIGSIEIQEIDSGRGAVGIGLFASAFSNASAQIDPNNNQLIFDLGGKYYQASIDGNSVTLQYLPNQNNLNGSIMNEQANHVLYANALAIVEVPVGYGHTLFTPVGDINVGLAVKFMQAMGYGQNLSFSVGKTPSVSVSMDDMDIAQTFGLDLGVLWTPRFLQNLHLGLVAKNLNAPVIKRTGGLPNTTLNRQLRAGVSYEMLDFLTFAFDADILPNDTLSLSSPKSQFIGGGVMANFKAVDFRLGAMQDMRSKAGEGIILTGGVNILGFLDVALQYGLGQNVVVEGINVSNYMSLRVGGQFSF